MSKTPTPLRRFITDKQARIVLWQAPNVPLSAWAIFAVLSHLFHPGNVRTATELISHAALIVWAVLEIYSGASYFRRTLGLLVLLATLVAILR